MRYFSKAKKLFELLIHFYLFIFCICLQLNLPPYASSLHFELYKTPTKQHYLQFFYRKPDVEYPQPMNIPGKHLQMCLCLATHFKSKMCLFCLLPGCGEKWTLDQFYIVHNKLIPGDFNAECKVEDENRLITAQ